MNLGPWSRMPYGSLAVAAAAAGACARGGPEAPPTTAADPIAACAEAVNDSTRFDRAPDHGATVVLDGGANVTIQPEIRSNTNTEPELQAGRVIARILNNNGGTFGRLAIQPDHTTCVWAGQEAGVWRMQLIAIARDGKAGDHDVLDMTVENRTKPHTHPDADWLVSISGDQVVGDSARKAGVFATAAPWATCTIYGCCRPRS